MFKYIYYRICKDWERKKELGKTFWESPPAKWLSSYFLFLFFPFAFSSGMLMESDNKLTSMLGLVPILALAMYLCNRFEKRMKNYTPPERFKKFDNTPLYCFTGPLVMLEILWGLLGTVLMIFCVIEPFHLEGWLYNLLIQ